MTTNQEPSWDGFTCYVFTASGRVNLFPNTTYSGIRFHELNLQGFNFFKCVFDECEFLDCELQTTDWSGSKFHNTKFINCDITDSTFNYSQFAGCHIEQSLLSNNRLAYSQFSQTAILNSRLDFAQIIFTDFCDSQIYGCSIDGTVMNNISVVNTPIGVLTAATKPVTIFNSRFNDLTMERVELADSNFHNSRFENVTFHFSNFWKSSFTAAVFIKCVAHHTGFNQAQFNGGAFCETQVFACRLRYANFDSVIFEESSFAFNQMDASNFEVSIFVNMELYGNWYGDHYATLWPKPCVPLLSLDSAVNSVSRTSENFVVRVQIAQIQGFDFGVPINVAFQELGIGRKQSHWIWYVFPQVAGLGKSLMSTTFAVQSCEDIKLLLGDSLVLRNLTRAFSLAVSALGNRLSPHLHDVFAHDAQKVVSSATLFAGYLDRHPQPDADELHSAANALVAVARRDGLSCSPTQQFLKDC